MRVVTKALHVAQDPAAVYEHASPACILCLLMHKISRAAAEEGLWNARQLLQDWLVRALANYNTNTNTHPKQTAGAGAPLQARPQHSDSLSLLKCTMVKLSSEHPYPLHTASLSVSTPAPA